MLIQEAQTESQFTRHGGAYDRGSADSYYRRGRRPHFFLGDTYMSTEITEPDMTDAEIEAYNRGYDDNEASGNHKDWF